VTFFTTSLNSLAIVGYFGKYPAVDSARYGVTAGVHGVSSMQEMSTGNCGICLDRESVSI